ncbi:MAG TPA: protein kinase [Kofleriaceae bacterium]|nr:protein kinase [Kofleriaceae bacterium]
MSVDAAAEEQFGPYLVYERLGVGGMATVHRALEQGAEGFERMVALKRLLPHLAEDASFIKSFVREAKLASILNHVNIVQIYELGRVGTAYFISMEYIDGRDLRRVLRHARRVTGPPPINITVGLMAQLCDALDYAHNKVDEEGHPLGLVHRDVSPSNLLITSGGHLKIIDFGIAKAQSSQLRTQTGRVKGKLAYMAPEAVSGSRDLDSRSDIWACGVILHELLTARPLFASKNEYQTLLKVQRGDIMPPSTFNQACPAELDTIVFRALARDPDQRYATAAELREALIAVKRQYALQTGYRDIASWLDWAFGLEPPQSFSNNPDSSGVSDQSSPRQHQRQKTPRPARITEEEEAVEVVWGGGNVESEDGPVVLEDVPDVSGKHQRPRRDTETESPEVDDIPTPLPSHGTMPSIYRGDGVPQSTRGSDQMKAQRSAPHTIPRSLTGPHPRPRGATSPGVAATTVRQTGQVPRLDAPQLGDRIAAQRARDSAAPENTPRPVADSGPTTNPAAHRLRTEPEVPTNPDSRRLRTDQEGMTPEDLFGVAAAEALERVSQEMDAMSTGTGLRAQTDEDETTLEPSVTPVVAPPTVPVVRFSKQYSTPPASVPVVPSSAGLGELTRAQPSTKPGIAPVRAVTAPPAGPRPIANVRIGETIAARGLKPKRTWLLVLGGIALAGGVATAVAVLGHDKSTTSTADKPTPPPTHETGKVNFVLEPTDAEIKIGGNDVHSGSPWSSELPAGVHQVEIHRSGYKSWLTSIELSANETQTLRVVLEPLTNNVASADASLTITTTPAGLEVVIDGHVQSQRTPFKGKLPVGAHKIAVRQNGVDVWQQNLTAEASSDYEFNPSFTADKQRERAQRSPHATSNTATADAAIKGDHQDPSPQWIHPGKEPAPSGAPTPVPAVVAPADKTPTTPITTPAHEAHAPATITAPVPSPAPAPTKPAPAPTAPPAAPKQNVAAPVTPAPAPAAPPKTAVAPVIVPPNAVKKLSGDVPSIERFKNVELPAALAAKVCIDETGKVSSATILSKVQPRVANDLGETLRTWRYAPHKVNGQAVPACFVVSFKAK